jgi:hypothetical protein
MEERAAEQTAAPAVETRPGDLKPGWFEFEGRTVVLQLREPYTGITHPGVPVKAEGGLAASELLRGILFVRPNGEGGIMIFLAMPDPLLEKQTRVYVALHPNDILYCSLTEAVEAPRIVSP